MYNTRHKSADKAAISHGSDYTFEFSC